MAQFGVTGPYNFVSDQKIVDSSTYLVVKNNYDNKADALSACRNGFAPAGEFDLAILDTLDKISALRTFMSSLVPGNLIEENSRSE